MDTVLLVIHILVALALVVTVLLQRSEGGALGIGGGGGGGMMSARGVGNALTKATAILAGVFFLTSIGLTILARQEIEAPSILEEPVEDSVVPLEVPEEEAPQPESDGLPSVPLTE